MHTYIHTYIHMNGFQAEEEEDEEGEGDGEEDEDEDEMDENGMPVRRSKRSKDERVLIER